ncbi:MAG: ABC-2 family transporter protein [Spirochaetales bacterium]|nr:ABC-2 family transporter protein [Spirochaetales bacterium]
MKTLIYYFKIYRRLAAQHIKSQMAFRTDFFFALFGLLFSSLLGFLSLAVIFQTISRIGGWNYHELLFLYGFLLLACQPQWIFFDNLWHLSGALQTGDFINCYFKPVNTLFYFISETISLKVIGRLGLAVFLLIYAGNKLNINWTLLKGFCFFLMFAGSALIYLSVRIMASSTAFWIISNISLMNFLNRLEDFSRYPVSIFSKPLQFFFSCIIPFAFIAYVPVKTFLKTGAVTLSWFITPALGCGLFALACLVWSLGVRQYTGTGT